MGVSVETATTPAEALRIAGVQRGVRILGGGTLVMSRVNAGDARISKLIAMRDPMMTQISVSGIEVVLGAGVTMARILAHRDLGFLHPAAQVVGGPAIRNMATVGGNLFARAPYGDMATLLLALGAQVVLAGRTGRPEPIETLWTRRGTGATVVQAIHVPRPRGTVLFHKMSRMQPRGPAIVTLAAALDLSAGRIREARIALGGVEPRPCLAQGAMRALRGAALNPGSIARASAEAMRGLKPITDSLASDWYRDQMVKVQLARLLSAATTGGAV